MPVTVAGSGIDPVARKATPGASLAGFLRDNIAVVGLAAAIALVTVVVSISTTINFGETRGHARGVARSYETIAEIEELLGQFVDIGNGMRGFLLTGQPEFLEPYQRARARVTPQFKLLRKLVADNPAQTQRLDALEPLVQQRLAHVAETIRLRTEEPNSWASRQSTMLAQGKALSDEIRLRIAAMKREETALLESRTLTAESSARIGLIVHWVGTGLSFAILIFAFVVLWRDLRRRRQSYEQIERLNASLAGRGAQLEAANKELESFSYSVSHDLRAPLRAVSGYAHMLQEDYDARLDEEGRRMLKVLRDSCARMGELIDDLLRFSQLGRTQMTAAAVDMTQLAREVFDALPAGGGAPAARFELKPMPEAWGDRALLRQVWANLLSNALKFTARAAQPLVEAGGEQTAGEYIYWVRDNGAGFDMRYYDKLFGVFQRLHRAEEFEGTGVGLAIVQRVAARHGGRVWAEGKVGAGAAFYFALPKFVNSKLVSG